MSGAITVGIIVGGGAAIVGVGAGAAIAIGIGAAAVGEVTGANDWVADNVTYPVLNAAGEVIDGFLDDPLKTIAQVAAVASGNAWALPLIAGADVAIAGGDIGDVLTAMAVSYVAGEAGEFVGDWAGEYIGDALAGTDLGSALDQSFINEMLTAAKYGTEIGSAQTAQLIAQDVGINALTNTIGQLVGQSLGDATTATVLGGDPLDAFTASLLSSTTKTAISGATALAPDSFKSLSGSTKDVITTSASTLLSGGDLSDAAAAAAGKYAAAIADGTSWLSKNTLGTGLDLNTPEGRAELAYRESVAATVLGDAFATAFIGGNVSQSIATSFARVGAQALGDKIVDISNSTYEQIKQYYDESAGYSAELDTIRGLISDAKTEYDNLSAEADGKTDELVRLWDIADAKIKAHNDNPNRTQATLDAANAAIAAYQAYEDTYIKYMAADGAYAVGIKAIANTMGELQGQYDLAYAGYEKAQTEFANYFDILNLGTDEALVTAKTNLVEQMTGDQFDAEWYAQAVGIDESQAVDHWLQVGQYSPVAVNESQEKVRYDYALEAYMRGSLESAGVSPDQLTEYHLKELSTQVQNQYNSLYGLEAALKSGDFAYGSDVAVGVYEAQQRAQEYYPDENTVLKYDTGIDPLDAFINPLRYVRSINSDGSTTILAVDNSSNYTTAYNPTTQEFDVTGAFVGSDGKTYYGTIPGTYAESIGMLADATGQLAPLEVTVYPRRQYSTVEERQALLVDPNVMVNKQELYTPDEMGGSLTYDFIKSALDSNNAALPAVRAAIDAAAEAMGLSDGAVALVEAANNYAKNLPADASDFHRNSVGFVLGSSSEIINAHLQTYERLNDTTIDPELRSALEDMQALGKDVNSQEYKDALARWNARVAPAKGQEGYVDPNAPWYEQAWQSAVNYSTAMQEEPGVFLRKAGSELFQEIPNIVAGFGAKYAIKGADALIPAKQEIVDKLSDLGGVATAVIMDISEAWGGTWLSVQEETYNEAKAAGKSEEEALALSYKNADATSNFAAVVAGVLGGVPTKMMFDVFTKDIPDALANGADAVATTFANALKAIGLEFLSEGAEEGSTQFLSGTFIKNEINPDYKVIENTALATYEGSTIGGSVAGSSMVGGLGVSATSTFIDGLLNTYSPTYAADMDAAIQSGDPNNIQGLLLDYGIDDRQIQTDIANVYFDDSVTTLNEVNALRDEQFNYYDFNDGDFDHSDYIGFQSEADTANAITSYVDPRYTDISEVQEEARKEGLWISDEQAAQFVGQTTEADTRTQVLSYADKNVTTREEAKAMFDALGYNVTDAELAKYPTLTDLQQGSTANAGDARKALRVSVGLDPYDAKYDVNKDGRVSAADAISILRMSQGLQSGDGTVWEVGAISEADAQAAVTEYTDARMVTYDEAKAYLEAQGYQNPTDAQINQFVGQANDPLFTQKQEAAIRTWYDENTVTPEEVQDYYESKGYVFPDNFTPDFSPLTGQYAESELAAKSDDFSGAMLYNMFAGTFDETEKRLTDKIAEYEANGVSRAEAIESAISDLSTQLGTSEETLLKAIGDTGESLRGELDTLQQALADDISALADQLGTTENNLSNAITDLASALGTTEESLVKAIEDGDQVVLDALGSPAEYDGDGNLVNAATGVYRDLAGLADQLGTTEENLTKNIDALATKLGTTEEALYAAIEAGNTTVLNALGKPAEYDADGNLVNAATGMYRSLASLAEQLGTTEASLNTALGELATQLGTTEASLIAAIEAGDTAVINALDSAIEGVNKDIGAVGDAVTTLAKQLGTTEEAILKAVEEGDTEILGALDTAVRDLQVSDALTRDEIQAVADFVGKPYTAVTQDDINFVNAIIAEGATDTDYATTPETQVYDVNQDGIVNQTDADIMAQLFADPTLAAQLAPESQYAQATGLYQTQQQYAQAQLEAQQQMQQELETQQQQNLNTILNTIQTNTDRMQADADNRLLAQLMQQSGVFDARTVNVTTPDPARINYMYDFNSIFANPEQEGLFMSPYSKGGKVDADDELLRYLGVK